MVMIQKNIDISELVYMVIYSNFKTAFKFWVLWDAPQKDKIIFYR